MRTLFICHNHPALHPGGTEAFALALHRAFDAMDDVESMFLACVNELHAKPNPGTAFSAAPGGASNEMLMWCGAFDRFHLSQRDLHGLVPEFRRLLTDFAPDVVHFHHVLLAGVELIKVARDTLPDARIVMTLHDYYPICHADGRMLRLDTGELCERASPNACARCFPDRDSDEFLTRKVHVSQYLSLVDAFVTPSEFAARRFIEFGLPASRIAIVRNGSTRSRVEVPPPLRTGPPPTLGYFGNLSRAKGVLLLLEAALGLKLRGVDFRLRIHGRAWYQDEDFVREFREAVDALGRQASHVDGYQREALPALLAEVDCVVVPSLWWENDPLVIQEAHWAGRPVVCADIGGMAEAVTHDTDGLHFRARDAGDLARVLEQALQRGRPGPAGTDEPGALVPSLPAPIESVALAYLEVYAGEFGERRVA